MLGGIVVEHERGERKEFRMGKLDGKVAFVTGAAHGIGRATARRLGQEGATVVIADIDRELGPETAAALVGEGLVAEFVGTDVACEESLKSSIDSTAERHGRIDILVNNAYWSAFGKVTELSKEDWDRSIATSLTAVFLGSKYAIPYMQRQGGGWIVNIGSIFGLVGGRNRAAYCSTKGAVVNLTRNMALDYIGDNIRVNCVCPGGVQTRPYANDDEDSPFWRTKKYPEALNREQRLLMHPIGRQGVPEEIAEAIAWLADPANKFTVGAALVVYGGLTVQSLI